jgi:hypothetical protein
MCQPCKLYKSQGYKRGYSHHWSVGARSCEKIACASDSPYQKWPMQCFLNVQTRADIPWTTLIYQSQTSGKNKPGICQVCEASPVHRAVPYQLNLVQQTETSCFKAVHDWNRHLRVVLQTLKYTCIVAWWWNVEICSLLADATSHSSFVIVSFSWLTHPTMGNIDDNLMGKSF